MQTCRYLVIRAPCPAWKAAEPQTGSSACGGLLLGPTEGRTSASTSPQEHRGCVCGSPAQFVCVRKSRPQAWDSVHQISNEAIRVRVKL
jgi:hypothetical protein